MAYWYSGTFDVLKSDIERYPELKEKIRDTFYDDDDDKQLLNENSYVADDDPIAHFCDDDARDGRFEDLEYLCIRLHVPYDRYTNADYGYDSYTAYYRPDVKEKEEILCDGTGAQTVDINELRNLIKDKKIDMKNAYAVGEVFLKYLDTIPVIRPLKEYEGYIYKMDDILQKRLGKIQAKAAADKEKERQGKEKAQQEWKDAFESIKKLAPRIANLLYLANACNDAGIKIYKDVGREDNFFSTSGFRHNLGFDYNHFSIDKKPIERFAIYNGGYYGDVDLYVNRNGIAQGYNKRTNEITKPHITDMKKFLKEFDHFEEEFLNFVDNL